MTGTPFPHFLRGQSQAHTAVRAIDWTATDLGPPDNWPAPLRATTEFVLSSLLPMFVAWGSRLEVIYNDAFIELLGAKHPGAMGKPHLDIWAEVRDSLQPFVQRALGGESLLIKDVAFDIIRDGDPKKAWVTFSYTPLRGDDGNIAGFQCVCVETTAVAELLAIQTRQRQSLEKLLSQAPGFLAVLRGPEHVFDLVNEEYSKLIGFRDVIGKSVRFALPEIVSQGFVELLDTVRDTGEPFVGKSIPVMLQRAKEEPLAQAYIDFVYQPLRGLMGEVDGILVQGHEVTREHDVREALLAFSNSIPAIAWVANPDGNLERFNDQWEACTGVPVADALGRGWTQQVHPDDLSRAGAAWKAARGGVAPWQVEYRLRSRDGSYRWFLARAVPQIDAGGRVLKWFGTTTDIEDLRRASHALMTADRQKDEFLATLAHELRNPLAPVRFAVGVLSSPDSPSEARTHALAVIGRQVDQMAHLLDDLIDVARITERRLVLRKEVVAVRDAMDAAAESARPLIESKAHALSVEVEQPIPQVMADPVRLTQIVTNLLTNAAKYTDVGGRIRMQARRVGDTCVLSVSDNGIGLSPESIRSIFEMYIQAQPALERAEGGLGIGLALVKGLVALHGGSVAARSEGVGRGATFEVVLPLAGDMPVAAPEPATEQRTRSRSKIVLLADDNADAVEVMAELIGMEGHAVHIARDGLQAVALAAQVRPDVVILDIGMPGLNGYEAARRIRDAEATAHCLLVAATGWGQENDRRRASDAGFDAHLTKPLEPEALFELIANGRPDDRAA